MSTQRGEMRGGEDAEWHELRRIYGEGRRLNYAIG